MSITKDERYNLIRILFMGQSNAILNSQEYKSLRASLTRGELKKIEKNFNEIASYAAKYFLKKYPKEKDTTDENIRESLMAAILACLDNGKK
jgi:hypothetical protein